MMFIIVTNILRQSTTKLLVVHKHHAMVTITSVLTSIDHHWCCWSSICHSGFDLCIVLTVTAGEIFVIKLC